MKAIPIREYQNTVLKALSGKISDFYLAGGTALSLFYFQHRESIDLDFFSPSFSYNRVVEITNNLHEVLKKTVKLIAQSWEDNKSNIMVYNVCFTENGVLKLDFVQDVFPLIKETKNVEGIKVLSLEDIYIRKIYAIIGILPALDMIGRKSFLGGRAEAKDFYDLYFLSHTFMPLSVFVEKYSDLSVKEGLINWFRKYDRMNIMDGVLRMKVNKKMNYKNMENHFLNEINKIVEKEIEGI
ncbi:MAG: nucleotidyl transferase AbiEii/AbiGii toxin family protein [Candidatus Omnitrophota bacterium]|nr:nucleotidyl transferase AbiEii/AbiGii toxin family protein [Candidatus Omnitrophota bacterium]